jgi:purine nucleosidase
MVKELSSGAYFHGENGIGDAPEHEGWEGRQELIQKDMSGAEAIVKLTKDHEDVSLLCIAPLTNIALALQLDPELPKRVKEIFIMGGTIHGKGNLSANLEYNFATDPQSAHNVFKAFTHINLIPWEPCHEYKITTEEMNTLFDPDHPKTKFYEAINRMNVGRYGHIDYCDGLACALAFDKSLANKYYDLEGKILLDGEAAGQISYAWPEYCSEYDPEKINCRVYTDFKHQESMDILIGSMKD